jgi:hypothetical protein
MRSLEIKHLFFGLLSLVLFCVFMLLRDSIGGFEGSYALYFFLILIIPIITYTLLYTLIVSVLLRRGINFLGKTLSGNLLVSFGLIVVLFMLYVWYDLNTFNRKDDFFSNFQTQLKMGYPIFLYFGISIPLLIFLSRKKIILNPKK